MGKCQVKMEQVLETLVKDTGGSPKLEQVQKAARLGLNFLESYSRAPATDYRRQVLPVVTACLDSGNSKICHQAAVPILHKIGKDNRFHSVTLEEDETSWLTHQVTSAILPLPALPGDLQTEVLQAILTLSCHPCWVVSGQVCLSLVTPCQELSQID